MRRNPTSYRGKTVLTSARLSELVYELPGRIRREIGSIIACQRLTIRALPKYNSRVLVATTHDSVFVVVRGTVFTSWKSWKANLKIRRSRWMKGKVHSGFLAVQKKAKRVYRPILTKAENRNKDVYFIGHSQGGAVSFVAAIDHGVRWSTLDIAANLTFGQPRTANKTLCRSAETRIGATCTRVANGRDIVVGVPYVWQGYDHLRWLYHYRRKGKVRQRTQRPGAGWYVATASIPKHFMKNYRKRAAINRNVNI